MAGRTFSLEPQAVPAVRSPYRVIQTPLPVPESVPILKDLRRYEPQSMTGQPPILWESAEGCIVRDRWGNQWLDWSSGVLVTNAGHGRKEIVEAIVQQATSPLLHNYCFPNRPRADLVKYLVELAPEPLKKCFLLTTGAETTECAIKLAKTHGIQAGGKTKDTIVSFENAFHGRTMGSQLAGGIPALKSWIGGAHPDFVQLPYPGDWRLPAEKRTFEAFVKALEAQGYGPARIAGVISETYQGGNVAFLPQEFAKKLRAWCDEHQIVLIFDEVQAGFGRCGTMFGFEHYGFAPDLATFGKGLSSSLPISCVLGRPELMDLYPPGSMTSTHTGNPICAAAALANLKLIASERLTENAAARGRELQAGLEAIREKHARRLGPVEGKGLAWVMHCVKPGGTEPDPDFAFQVVDQAIRRGLLLFAPVGLQGSVVKICPALCVSSAQIADGLLALGEAYAAAD
ncbi:MAG: aminotransferase class III-fold pyridoxal phosphate-dependent enzyme [Planctomycetota bacterium]|nr:aminotransferase class III-fold pyridoxal phosphate-dependent enzyme [Planctomycetota bacterium]